jgi:hypothetical protein
MRRRLPALVLALFAVINIGRGSIHAFAPDGGAHSIAGLDLGSDAVTIVSLFATIGLMQLVLGLFQLWVLLRARAFVLPVLALQTALTVTGAIHLHWYRPLPVVVPGAAFNLGLAVLLIATWAIVLFPRKVR